MRDAEGNTRQYVALFSDITSLKEHEQKLEHIAHYDALTSLPNRVLLADRLHQGMAQARGEGNCWRWPYLDLDGFKAINDNHGHEAGDQLLIAVATRMKQALREGDTLARLGGDEFVAVLLDLARYRGQRADAHPPARRRGPAGAGRRLLRCRSRPVSASPSTRRRKTSMRINCCARPTRPCIRPSWPARTVTTSSTPSRIAVSAAITKAWSVSATPWSHSEFVLYYQPKVNMRTGTIIGAEALIRWQHPERGLLPPWLFLPVIEDHPLAVELGEWVIDTALTQMELWHAAGLDIPVSVNVGARQLQQADFVERLRAVLAAHPKLRPGDLELEVLETSALEDLARVSQIIEACRETRGHVCPG